MIWELRHEFKLSLLLDIAELPRSTYYYYVKHRNDEDKYSEIKKQITDIFHENKGRYGYRRITMEMHNRGYVINHKTVLRLMNEEKIKCTVRIKKYRSYKGEVGKVAPNLLERDFSTKAPNEKWVTDVTEFSLFGRKLYLSPILDLHSSDIVSYTISEHPALSLVMAPGINSKMDEVRCAYGLINLKQVDQAIAQRQKVAQRYREALRDVPGIRFFDDIPGVRHNYSYFPVFVNAEDYGMTRDELYFKLQEQGIFGRRYFYPLISTFAPYRDLPSAAPENLPVATKIADEVICLPMHHALSEADIERVTRVVKK